MMIRDENLHWLERQSLGEIAQTHYMEIKPGGMRVIDVKRLLHTMEEEEKRVTNPLFLNIRGINDLPIGLEEKYEIHKVALRIILGIDKEEFQNEPSCIFLAILASLEEEDYCNFTKQNSSRFFSFVKKIYGSKDGGEERLRRFATLFTSFTSHRERFLSFCYLLAQDDLSFLLEITTILLPFKEDDRTFLSILNSIFLVKTEEKCSLAINLLYKSKKFVQSTLLETLKLFITLSPKERLSTLDLIDLPSLPSPLLPSSKIELSLLCQTLQTIPKEKRRALLLFAVESGEHFPSSYDKLSWLQQISTLSDLDNGIAQIRLVQPLLNKLTLQEALHLLRTIHERLKENISPILSFLLPKIDILGATAISTIFACSLQLRKEQRPLFLENISLPSFPLLLKTKGQFFYLYMDDLLSLHEVLQKILPEMREKTIRLTAQSSDRFNSNRLSDKISWLQFLNQLPNQQEAERIITLCHPFLEDISVQGAIAVIKTMMETAPEGQNDLLQRALPFTANIDSREWGNLLLFCRGRSKEELSQLWKRTQPLFPRLKGDEKNYTSHRVLLLQNLLKIEKKKREEVIQLLEEGTQGVEMTSGRMDLLLTTIATISPEDGREFLKEALIVVQAALPLDLNGLQFILKALKEIPRERKSDLASSLVRFYSHCDSINRWNDHNHSRVAILLSSLSSQERDTIIEEGKELFKGGPTAIIILDLLRYFPSSKERVDFVQLFTPFLPYWIRPVDAPLLSHLLTVPSTERTEFLKRLQKIVEKRTPLFINRMMIALSLQREGITEEFFQQMEHCLHRSLDPLQYLLSQPEFTMEALSNLTAKSEKGYLPPEISLDIATTILDQALVDEDDPLYLWAIQTCSLLDSAVMNDPKNPYRLFPELRKILATEPPIHLPLEELPPFEVRIAASGELFSCQWNLERLRHLSQKGENNLQYTASSIPQGITHTTLMELYTPMKGRLKELESRIYEKSALSLRQLQAFFEDSFIISLCHHLNPSLPSTRSLPRDALQFSFILRKIYDSSSEVAQEGGFSPREELLITLVASIQECPTGKSNSINDFYQALEPSYRRLMEIRGPKDFLNDLLQRVLHQLFTKEQLIKELTGNTIVGQQTHITRFLKNRLSSHLGLQAKLEFDPYTTGLPDAIFTLFQQPEGVRKAVQIFLAHLSIDGFLHLSGATASQTLLQTIAKIDQESSLATGAEKERLEHRSYSLLEELKALSATFQHSLFGPHNFTKTMILIARGLGHTAEDDYSLTRAESDRIFNPHEGLTEAAITPLTEEAVLRMLFATILTVRKIQ